MSSPKFQPKMQKEDRRNPQAERKDVSPPELNDPAEELLAPAHEEIATLAYSYWEARGEQGGSAWEDWFRAEEELKRRKG